MQLSLKLESNELEKIKINKQNFMQVNSQRHELISLPVDRFYSLKKKIQIQYLGGPSKWKKPFDTLVISTAGVTMVDQIPIDEDQIVQENC